MAFINEQSLGDFQEVVSSDNCRSSLDENMGEVPLLRRNFKHEKSMRELSTLRYRGLYILRSTPPFIFTTLLDHDAHNYIQ
jgi:hypothetical protein